MSGKLNIDESIRSKFEDFSVDPPAHVWDAVQDKMALQKKRSRRMMLTWVSAAAVVVVAFMAGWYFSNSSSDIASDFVENQPKAIQEKLPIEKGNDFAEQNKGENNISTETKAKNIDLGDEKLLVASVAPSVSSENKNTTTPKVSVAPNSIEQNHVTREDNLSLLARIDAFISDQTEALSKELLEIDNSKNAFTLSEADRLLVAANSARLKKEKEHEKGWIVGAHLTPSYSSHSVEHDQSYASNIAYQSNNASENIGGGFSVQYKAGKRVRVESGVYYAKNGQRSKNSFSNSGLFNDKLDFAVNPTQLQMDKGGFSTNVNFDRLGTLVMNSTAGIIRLKKGAPAGTTIIRADAENKYMSDNLLTSDGSFSQVFDFIEIPLMLRYNLFERKIGLDILGGVNAGFVVGNNAYLSNDFGRQNIGQVEDISTVNISGTIGLGMKYALGKHFSLALEPRFNYYLNSISTNSDVDYKPYRFALFTGVNYEF